MDKDARAVKLRDLEDKLGGSDRAASICISRKELQGRELDLFHRFLFLFYVWVPIQNATSQTALQMPWKLPGTIGAKWPENARESHR